MGFDWTTFIFELINFGLLLWILQRVLYRPLREGIESRRAALAEERDRALAANRAATELRSDAEARLAEIEKLRETVIADAREQAAKEESRILEQARQDAAAERERVERTLERERGEAIVWIREATVDNSVEIAGRLLNDLLPHKANAVLLQALVDSLRRWVERGGDGSAFESMLASEAGRTTVVELSMPSAPPEEELKSLRMALVDALEGPWELSIKEDPSLVAGAVLRIEDQVLDASLAGHLSALRERVREVANEAAQHD